MSAGGQRARRLLVLAALCVAVLLPPTAQAQPSGQRALGPGAVVTLAGTPHLWVADPAGMLHWAGDTRGLAGRVVDWGSRTEVTLSQLRQYVIGDPWLSAGLLKRGDEIYLVKWELAESQPTLLHIRAISDVELFGITEHNYGVFVLGQDEWERRFMLPSDAFERGVLAPAAKTPGNSPPANLVVRLQGVVTPRLGGTSRVLGELRNDGGEACGVVVTATFTDSSGTVVAGRSAAMSWMHIAAGGLAPFDVRLPQLPNYQHLDVRATSTASTESCGTVMLVAGAVSVRQDASARYTTFRASGTIANTSGAAVQRVRLAVSFHDKDGLVIDVVGADSAGYSPVGVPLAAGQSAAFDVPSVSAATNPRVAAITSARVVAAGDKR